MAPRQYFLCRCIINHFFCLEPIINGWHCCHFFHPDYCIWRRKFQNLFNFSITTFWIVIKYFNGCDYRNSDRCHRFDVLHSYSYRWSFNFKRELYAGCECGIKF